MQTGPELSLTAVNEVEELERDVQRTSIENYNGRGRQLRRTCVSPIRGARSSHVTIPARLCDEDFLEEGKMFDGSSIAGWKGINESDMVLMPRAGKRPYSIRFFRGNDAEPAFVTYWSRPLVRGTNAVRAPPQKRAEAYLKSTGVADSAYFGPRTGVFRVR